MVNLGEYRELNISDFKLLVVMSEPGIYRLYVSRDGQNYCHYDTGNFEDAEAAARAARSGFDSEPFRIFPWTPYSRKHVLERVPDALEDLQRSQSKED